jgi:hypothetical protein
MNHHLYKADAKPITEIMRKYYNNASFQKRYDKIKEAQRERYKTDDAYRSTVLKRRRETYRLNKLKNVPPPV